MEPRLGYTIGYTSQLGHQREALLTPLTWADVARSEGLEPPTF